jgi:hypothetical protein
MEDKNTTIDLQLQDFLPWHKARLKFLNLFIVSLIRNRNVSYSKNAATLNNRETCTNLRRIQRFFTEFSIDFDLIARLLVAIIPMKRPYQLSLDRTNWKFAGVNFNILCLTIVADNVSLPILWTMLDKRGNSNQEERKLLILRYIHLFGLESIDCIIADREFIGQEWFKFLIDNPIKFYLRIRENLIVSHKGRELRVSWLFNNLPLNTIRQIDKPILIGEHWVYLTGMKIINKKGDIEFVIVATYKYDCLTMQVYAKRWTIECFFKAIKTAGFNLEDTHLKDQKRLEKLLAVIAIAFVWVYLIGEYENQQKPIAILAHQRRAFSIFRYGLDNLIKALTFDNQIIKDYLQLLTRT